MNYLTQKFFDFIKNTDNEKGLSFSFIGNIGKKDVQHIVRFAGQVAVAAAVTLFSMQSMPVQAVDFDSGIFERINRGAVNSLGSLISNPDKRLAQAARKERKEHSLTSFLSNEPKSIDETLDKQGIRYSTSSKSANTFYDSYSGRCTFTINTKDAASMLGASKTLSRNDVMEYAKAREARHCIVFPMLENHQAYMDILRNKSDPVFLQSFDRVIRAFSMGHEGMQHIKASGDYDRVMTSIAFNATQSLVADAFVTLYLLSFGRDDIVERLIAVRKTEERAMASGHEFSEFPDDRKTRHLMERIVDTARAGRINPSNMSHLAYSSTPSP